MVKDYKKINKTLTHFDEINCPVCDSRKENTITLFKIDRWLKDCKKICKNCGLIYQSPRWSIEDTNRFYNEFYLDNYFWLGNSISSPEEEHYQFWLTREKQIYMFQKEIKNAEKPIEIWCSSWWVLEIMKKINPNVIGIDLDEKSVNYAIKKWLKASVTSLFDLKNDTFDFVLMSHVCEHLIDPDNFLWKVNHILIEWWYLLIIVPNSYGIPELPHTPHTFCFSTETLISMISKNWFSVIKKDNTFHNDITILFKKDKDAKWIKSTFNKSRFIRHKIATNAIALIIKFLEKTWTKTTIIRIFKINPAFTIWGMIKKIKNRINKQ